MGLGWPANNVGQGGEVLNPRRGRGCAGVCLPVLQLSRMGSLGMSGGGTNRTKRADLMMSVPRGNAEVAFRGHQDRF
jgi:hypothetical protein